MEKVAKKSVWFEEKSRFYTMSGRQNRVFHKVFQAFPTVLHKQILKNYPYKRSVFNFYT